MYQPPTPRQPPVGVQSLPELLTLAEDRTGKAAGHVPLEVLAAACGVSARTWRDWRAGSVPRDVAGALALEVLYGFVELVDGFGSYPDALVRRAWRRDVLEYRRDPVKLTRDALAAAQSARAAWRLADGQLVVEDPAPEVPSVWPGDRFDVVLTDPGPRDEPAWTARDVLVESLEHALQLAAEANP